MKFHECWARIWLTFVDNHLEHAAISPEVAQNLAQCFQQLRQSHKYQDVGGALLPGVRKTVVVAHGCSRELAISNAIHLAVRSVQANTIAHVVDQLEKHPILPELRQYSARWLLSHWKNKWGGIKKHA